jgi:hypothetical protein
MIMKKRVFLRIVTALSTAAVILGAIDFYELGRLTELHKPPAVRTLLPTTPTEVHVIDDDQDLPTGGSCMPQVEAAQKSRMD